MYRGQHRRDPSRPARSARALGVIALTSLIAVGAVLPSAAFGWARPKECTGSAPTAITIQQQLSGADGDAVSFAYEIWRDGSLAATATLSVAPNSSASTTVGGLGPGDYRVDQYPDPASPVAPAPSAYTEIDPPACAPTVTFTSLLGEA